MAAKTRLQSAGDGSVIPENAVGTRLISTGSQTGNVSGVVTVNLSTAITLTPGIWLVQARAEAGTIAPRRVDCVITNSANADLADSDGLLLSASVSDTSNSANANSINTGIQYFRISSGSTQGVKAKAIVNFPSAGGAVTVQLQAIRIA